MNRWLTKVRRWDGSESVVDHFENKASAVALADDFNESYQTDSYFVQENRTWELERRANAPTPTPIPLEGSPS